MSKDLWAAVDQYFGQALLSPDPVLDEALADQQRAGLPAINVAPHQGKFLQFLVRMSGAKRVLEIGTLGGYSAIWLARGLPADGRMITLESDPHHAAVAAKNLSLAGFDTKAGLDAKVDIRIGRAIETLPKIAAEGRGPFDFIFIDADKPSNTDYFQWALKLARVGTLIIVDNVVRNGKVLDSASHDDSVKGVQRLRDYLSVETRVDATVLQTVGAKGYDGMILALVKEPG